MIRDMSRKCQDLHIIKHKKIIPTYFLLKVLLIYELDQTDQDNAKEKMATFP